MAETLVKCACGDDMSVSEQRRYPHCEHCDGTICPNFKKISLSSIGCPRCATILESLDA